MTTHFSITFQKKGRVAPVPIHIHVWSEAVLGQDSLFTGGCSCGRLSIPPVHSTFTLANGGGAAGDTCLWAESVTLSAPGRTLMLRVHTSPGGAQRQQQTRGLSGEGSRHSFCQLTTPGLVAFSLHWGQEMWVLAGSAMVWLLPQPNHQTLWISHSWLVRWYRAFSTSLLKKYGSPSPPTPPPQSLLSGQKRLYCWDWNILFMQRIFVSQYSFICPKWELEAMTESASQPLSKTSGFSPQATGVRGYLMRERFQSSLNSLHLSFYKLLGPEERELPGNTEVKLLGTSVSVFNVFDPLMPSLKGM